MTPQNPQRPSAPNPFSNNGAAGRAGAPSAPNPFVREGHLDKPGIIGSHWWNKELADASALRSRRHVILGLVAAAGTVTALGTLTFAIADSSTREELRRAIDLQRDLGWSFGATSETVAFEEQYTTTYAKDALPRMVTDLTPRNKALQPWFTPTLFQSPEALPRLPQPDPDAPTPTVLASALRPIHTPSMILAERAGKALADLLAAAGPGIALVIDIEGPESVAFAAGAADRFEPVFLFDNWPHPKGVVPAHLTLAAAVYHQPRFAQAAPARPPNAPPAFVLDRRRLSPYTDEAAQFDNRWLAKLPSPEDMVTLEIKRVLYVAPSQKSPIEQPDAGEYLDAWARKGLDVRAIAFDAFGVAEDGTVRFGASIPAGDSFFGHYPWRPPIPAKVPVPKNDEAAAWRPHATAMTPTEKNVGLILVDVDKRTGAVVGPHTLRSGSYNRASGGWGG